MAPIRIPAARADDWRALLADPQRHWRVGCSAYELAHAWQGASSLPRPVAVALDGAPFGDLEPLLALPEHKTTIPGAGGSSATDLLLLGRGSGGDLVAVAVEGKVDEPFGPDVGHWLDDDTLDTDNQTVRLVGLAEMLGIGGPVPQDIPYQLLHRTASALIAAQRFNAHHAILLVHSFSPTQDHHDEYVRFAKLLGVPGEMGHLEEVGTLGGIRLYLCWVADKPRAQAHDGDPDAVFLEALDWLRDTYRQHRFFKERDVEAVLQARMTELFEERRSDLRVYENHRVPGKQLDLAVVDRGKPTTVLLGIELKYEPDPKRAGADIRGDTAKLPVCLREEIARDIAEIQRCATEGLIRAGYALLLDEGGYWRDRRTPPSGELTLWGKDTKTRRAPAVFVTRSSDDTPAR